MDWLICTSSTYSFDAVDAGFIWRCWRFDVVLQDGNRPSTPALWWINGKGGEVRWSFEELGVLSRKVANVLSDPCGLQRGDRAILILPRVPEWWLLNVACMRAGEKLQCHIYNQYVLACTCVLLISLDNFFCLHIIRLCFCIHAVYVWKDQYSSAQVGTPILALGGGG